MRQEVRRRVLPPIDRDNRYTRYNRRFYLYRIGMAANLHRFTDLDRTRGERR